jgi:hypothetical protein
MQARAPRLSAGLAGPAGSPDHTRRALSLKASKTPDRLMMELQVLLDTATDPGINMLRAGVWETALQHSTVEVSC